MPDFKSEQIRNISIIGHGSCGKTILTEGMLFAAGVTNRFGKIEEGNTVSDYHKDEIERQQSINSSLLNCFWKNSKTETVKFNIIDTPGFMDFLGEVKSALRVTETALMVVDSFKGVEVGTEACFKFTKENNNNIIFVINKLDAENAVFEDTLEQLKESFGSQVAVVQFPVNHGVGFNEVIDVIKMKMLKFNTDGKGEYQLLDIPADFKDKADDYHQKLVEAIASEDDALMEKFFDSGSLSEEEITNGLKLGLRERRLFPVFCTSASTNVGIKPLMDFIADYSESPADKAPEKGHRPNSSDVIEVKPDSNAEPVLFIFKTISEKNIGELSFFRVYSGKVTPGMDMINEATGKSERLAQTYTMNGKDRKEIAEVITGDFAGVVKLKDSHTNNTLCAKSFPVVLNPINFPTPNMTLAIAPSRKGEEDKLGTALHSFHEEDPTFVMNYDPEISQTLIHGQGEIHINTIINRMKAKYGLDVVLSEPKIPYKETIRRSVDNVEYKHKKQTGGRGQFGHVVIKVEPQPRGQGFEFVDAIVGGVVPNRFIPAVEKGVIETMQSGVMIGCKVIDVKVTLHFGSYHTVDSDELSFKLAASQAFRKGFKEASPVILEPIYEVEIFFPEEFMGAVSGDVSSRRGKILGMESEGRLQVIKCHIPLSEMSGYSSKLRSFTQGRGTYTRKFSHYEDVPKEVETKIIADYEKKKAEEQK
ncbi:MAG TPA: elongation factor G [Ignavibacteria bacterium]|nr:elongation factor G [Ignavibacteria bacterium]